MKIIFSLAEGSTVKISGVLMEVSIQRELIYWLELF